MTFPPVILTMSPRSLPLDATRCVTRRQAPHVIHAHSIEVSGNGMFQRSRGNRELQRLHRPESRRETVDEPSGKGVAGTNAIDDSDVVPLALEQRPACFTEHSAPSVVARGDAFSERDGAP